MAKYRKKPVVVEAVQWTGGNPREVVDFAGYSVRHYSEDFFDVTATIDIETLEGVITVLPGDWVVQGVNGEFYPCKPDIFEKTYERVEE